MLRTMRRLFPVVLGGLAWAALAGELSETENLRLRAAKPGAVVQLPEFLKRRADLPHLPATVAPDVGPQFLLSDKPEYFYSGNGIALQEEVQPGVVRLYLYHVPTPGEARKTITAVLENLGDKPLKLSFRSQAAPPPGRNYPQAAKAALAQFLKPKPATGSRTLPAKACAPLDPLLDGRTAGRDELVHAIYEFEITQPARVTVLQRDPEQKSVEAVVKLPKLPQVLPGHEKGNGAGRGLLKAAISWSFPSAASFSTPPTAQFNSSSPMASAIRGCAAMTAWMEKTRRTSATTAHSTDCGSNVRVAMAAVGRCSCATFPTQVHGAARSARW